MRVCKIFLSVVRLIFLIIKDLYLPNSAGSNVAKDCVTNRLATSCCESFQTRGGNPKSESDHIFGPKKESASEFAI